MRREGLVAASPVNALGPWSGAALRVRQTGWARERVASEARHATRSPWQASSVVLLMALCCLACPLSAVAQGADEVPSPAPVAVGVFRTVSVDLTLFTARPGPPMTLAQSTPTARAKISKRKAVLIGAAIGGGAGAAVGASYCRADCGGGPARGAVVFAPFGAAIGAAVGLVAALLP